MTNRKRTEKHANPKSDNFGIYSRFDESFMEIKTLSVFKSK
jgi:hypothetical protein